MQATVFSHGGRALCAMLSTVIIALLPMLSIAFQRRRSDMSVVAAIVGWPGSGVTSLLTSLPTSFTAVLMTSHETWRFVSDCNRLAARRRIRHEIKRHRFARRRQLVQRHARDVTWRLLGWFPVPVQYVLSNAPVRWCSANKTLDVAGHNHSANRICWPFWTLTQSHMFSTISINASQMY